MLKYFFFMYFLYSGVVAGTYILAQLFVYKLYDKYKMIIFDFYLHLTSNLIDISLKMYSLLFI